MPDFASRWLVPAKRPNDRTDSTDESPFGSSVSATEEGVGPNVVGTYLPPPGCIAWRHACPVLGPCDRHLAGAPCLVADVAQEESAA
jgi:hypothetical protein